MGFTGWSKQTLHNNAGGGCFAGECCDSRQRYDDTRSTRVIATIEYDEMR